MPRQADLFRDIRQVQISHVAHCETCEQTLDARNAQGWASLHVKRNPGHCVHVTLVYRVRDHGGVA